MEFLYGFCFALLLLSAVYKLGEYLEKKQAQGQIDGIATA
jgi:hypothetical protein